MRSWNYRVVARVEYSDSMRQKKVRPVALFDVAEVAYEGDLPSGYAQGKSLCQNKLSYDYLAEEHVSMRQAFDYPTLWYNPDTNSLVDVEDYRGLLSRYDRILGCLLGCALGDAIGAPLEAQSVGECRKYVKDHVLTNDYEGVHRAHHSFGQVTDDTQCLRIIAQSFDHEGWFQGGAFAEHLAKFHVEKGLVGYGVNTNLAINTYLTEGLPWHECGRPDPACGNGAAMRAAILGVANTQYGELTSFSKLVRESCLSTHAAEESIFGAEVVAGVARELVNDGGDILDARSLMVRVLLALNPEYGGLDIYQDYMSLLEILRIPDPEERDLQASALADSLQPRPTRWGDGLSPYVRPSVLWGVYSMISEPTDFTKTIAKAISCGGDVDTTAAIAGSLFGVYNGTAMLDRDLLGQLHDRGEWLLTDYIELAHTLDLKMNRKLKSP